MCPASNLLYQIPERSFVRMKAVSSPQKLAAFGGLFLFRLGTILALASGRFSEARKKPLNRAALVFQRCRRYDREQPIATVPKIRKASCVRGVFDLAQKRRLRPAFMPWV
jgi:hypothetical protein